MTERKNRVADEPKDNYWVISVKLPDGPRMKRNFPKDGTYQVHVKYKMYFLTYSVSTAQP